MISIDQGGGKRRAAIGWGRLRRAHGGYFKLA